MKNGTILLFSGSLSKICCTKLDLLQDIRKFYGALFDVHGFLKYERRHQSVAFNSLATQWVYIRFSFYFEIIHLTHFVHFGPKIKFIEKVFSSCNTYYFSWMKLLLGLIFKLSMGGIFSTAGTLAAKQTQTQFLTNAHLFRQMEPQ